MEIPTKEDQELIVLARRLPVKDDFRNWRRIHHAKIFGHVLIVRQEGRIVGFAELYRMRYAPDYPVKPWPKDDPEGKVLYCYAAVCEKGFIRELINLAHRTFPGLRIEYHRRKHGNKLYSIERAKSCLEYSHAG